MIRSQLIKYMNNTFPLVKITNLPKFDQIKTPLFSINNFQDNYYFSYDINKIPSLYLLRYIENIDNKLKIENNCIPLRWYYILKEFYLPDLNFLVQNKDYTDKVNHLSNIVINNIVYDATNFNNINYAKLTVKDEKWITKDYSYYKYTKETNIIVDKFFENSKKYQSLKGEYNYLHACEGGIEFTNSYVDDFIQLNHSQLGKGSIRNEVKGHNTYITGKDITIEELMVLHLIMLKEGIENDINL